MCQRLKNNVYHEIYTEAIEPLTHHYMNHMNMRPHSREATHKPRAITREALTTSDLDYAKPPARCSKGRLINTQTNMK